MHKTSSTEEFMAHLVRSSLTVLYPYALYMQMLLLDVVHLVKIAQFHFVRSQST